MPNIISEQAACATSSLELKCPDWRDWAYTDGSCIKEEHNGKEIQFIGAGVYHPATHEVCYVQPGGLGMTNTINRAELAGIYAALLNGHTHIASDSACSLSQIRKQLLFPELQRNHIHSHLLKPIIDEIQASPNTIHFYKVKAHAGIAGNEFADAIAKHSAQHDCGHTRSFDPVSYTGNPYSHMYWLAERETIEGPDGTETRLTALSNLKDKLTVHARDTQAEWSQD